MNYCCVSKFIQKVPEDIVVYYNTSEQLILSIDFGAEQLPYKCWSKNEGYAYKYLEL